MRAVLDAASCSRTKTSRTLLTADYTFVNERLARHYGIDGVVGPQFRRVAARRTPCATGCSARARCCCARRTATARRRCCAAPGCSTSSWARRRRRRRPASRRISTHARGRAAEDGARAARAASRESDAATPATASSTRTAWRSRTSRRPARWRDYDEDADAPIDARTELLRRQARSTAPSTLTAALLERDDQFVQALTEKLMMYARRPRARVLRHAASARRRARRERRGLSVLGARRGHRAAAMRSACRRAAAHQSGSAQASLGEAGASASAE